MNFANCKYGMLYYVSVTDTTHVSEETFLS